ncbi:MFS transporter [Asticcacaulis tiandongensis]|uniref:MFS transporter n=1 Tax=Asticcacaulis tiandongensis TaxID=2565365 RepID=UPI0015E87316|nr:MFS transporter [Asticcacaulis tiandongensis]
MSGTPTSPVEPSQAPEPAPAKKPSLKSIIQENGALSVMLAVVFVNLVGFGLVVPLLPFFAKSLEAQIWQVTLMFAAYSFGQFFAEPFWGSLSDKIGRKPVLVVTTAMNALFYLALAFAPTIWWAIFIRFFNGIGSGNVSTIQSYVSDMSEPHQKAGRMSLIGAAFSLGFIIGPVIGGFLAHEEDGVAGFRLPLFVAAGMAATAAIGVLLYVKESRKRTTSAPPVNLRQTFMMVRKDPILVRIILTTLCYMAAFAGLESTFGLWADARYGWQAREVGLVFLGIGVAAAVMQVYLTRRLVRRFGETRVLAGGLVVFGLGFILQSFNNLAPLVTPIVMLAATGQAVVFATISALISLNAPPERQGAVLGLNMAAGATARIIGPIAAGFLFSITTDAPLWFGAVMCLVAAFLALKVEKAGQNRLSA